MRSDLVFNAESQVANRFLLATIAMRFARKLHISSNATEHTVNRVLSDIGNGHFTDAKLPVIATLPAVEIPLNVYAAHMVFDNQLFPRGSYGTGNGQAV